MKLYIANCSPRDFHFNYRIPEGTKILDKLIRAGSQVEIDGSKTDIDYIIEKNRIYGFKTPKEIGTDNHFSGFAYQIDKKIDVDAIRAGLAAVDIAALQRQQDAREAGAAAVEGKVSEIAKDSGNRIRTLEMSIKEEKKNAYDNDSKFEQTVAVSRSEPRGRGRPPKS